MGRAEELNDWFNKAEKDLTDAKMHRDHGTVYEASAFMCHQAVEKALTGYLVSIGQEGISSHDLPLLGRYAETSLPELGNLKTELALVNRYYLEMTYPDDLRYEISSAIVDECIRIAGRILELVRETLKTT